MPVAAPPARLAMEPLESPVNRWSERAARPCARGHLLPLPVPRRFLDDDDLFQAAGALAYTTVFALVPLSMVVFGVLSAFPVFNEWSDRLSDYIFSNFVPSAARSVEAYLKQFSANAGQLTTAGVIALVVSLLITLYGVEATFNRIWRVKSARPRLGRFLVYWTVLTLGALMAAASLAISARFFAMSVFETQAGHVLQTMMLRAGADGDRTGGHRRDLPRGAASHHPVAPCVRRRAAGDAGVRSW